MLYCQSFTKSSKIGNVFNEDMKSKASLSIIRLVMLTVNEKGEVKK